ncbi:inorganic pyrophosphatase [Chloroflexota bacterium]
MVTMTDAEGFWAKLAELVAGHELVIDRPRGSPHPRHPTTDYALDYGYLRDTTSTDGGGVDVWIGSLAEQHVTGLVCTVDLEKCDAEVKILLGCTRDEMDMVCKMHNAGDQSAILVGRA